MVYVVRRNGDTLSGWTRLGRILWNLPPEAVGSDVGVRVRRAGVVSETWTSRVHPSDVLSRFVEARSPWVVSGSVCPLLAPPRVASPTFSGPVP